MLRVCIYIYDQGVFRRSWIQGVTEKEYLDLSESTWRKVIILDEDDWYGKKCPSVFCE